MTTTCLLHHSCMVFSRKPAWNPLLDVMVTFSRCTANTPEKAVVSATITTKPAKFRHPQAWRGVKNNLGRTSKYAHPKNCHLCPEKGVDTDANKQDRCEKHGGTKTFTLAFAKSHQLANEEAGSHSDEMPANRLL